MITPDYRPPAETQFVTRPLYPSPLDMAKMWDYAPRQETNPITPDRFHPPGTLPHPGKVTTLYPRPFMPKRSPVPSFGMFPEGKNGGSRASPRCLAGSRSRRELYIVIAIYSYMFCGCMEVWEGRRGQRTKNSITVVLRTLLSPF